MTEATAPGKLVLCGEYAVLDGGPGIAVAVDARARARVEAAATGRLTVAGGGAWDFDAGPDGMPRFARPPPLGQGRVLEVVWATLRAADLAPARPLSVDLDTGAFRWRSPRGDEVKLGLGSSAAIVTTLTAALLAHAGHAAGTARVLELAMAAHRRLQAGEGSGIDVAAAVHGGVIALVPGSGGAIVHRLAWPAGLHALAAWSGEAASTPALLARVAAFRRRDPVACRSALAEAAAAACEVLARWEAGDTAAVLAGLDHFGRRLQAFDAAGAIGIDTPAHARLAALAQAAGALYRTSGAGGGDFGLALADAPAPIARFAASCAAHGILTLPVGPAVPGLTPPPPRSSTP